MPHSEPLDSQSSTALMDEAMAEPTPIANGESQSAVSDITMADTEAPTAPEVKKEVNLDDLFADVESDDEFPSSRGQDTPVSSSPEAPPSPT
jgi:DNA primase small subunit